MPKSFNIVVPVHLSGGILQPGESMGNRIGAFVAPLRTKFLPGSRSYSTEDNLASVSLSLKEQKYSPSAFISWYIAKFASNYLPDAVTKKLMLLANANAVCAISNVRLPLQNKLHLNGRPIESMCGFLPLPPGIPKRHEGAYTANLFLTPHSSYDVQNSAEFGFSLTGGCLWAE